MDNLDSKRTARQDAGLGVNPDYPMLSPVKETRMLVKAVAQRWPIDDNLKAQVVEYLHSVVNDPHAKHREKLAATKALMQADALNLAQEKHDNPQEKRHVHLHANLTDVSRAARLQSLAQAPNATCYTPSMNVDGPVTPPEDAGSGNAQNAHSDALRQGGETEATGGQTGEPQRGS